MNVFNTVMLTLHSVYGGDKTLNLAAVQTGSYQVLRSRTDWQWGPLSNAEAIIGLTLANNRWYQKHNAATYISVQAMELELAAELSIDKSLKASEWSRGKLAEYVTALQLTCHDPSKFYRHDLLKLLRQHMQASEVYFRANRLRLAWLIIALCNNNRSIDDTSRGIITDNPGNYKFGVDEASMILMASVCLKEQSSKQAAETYIATELRTNISEYNESTKGLAVQALIAAKTKGVDDIINTAQSHLREAILPSTSQLLEFPGAAARVLPALAGKSYLDAGKVVCPQKDKIKKKKSSNIKINVRIKVIDAIVNNTNDTWTSEVWKDSSLYAALQSLRQQSKTFRFRSKKTWDGQSVQSINGVAEDIGRRLYWKIEDSKGKRLSMGVNKIIPSDGDIYTFRFASS